MGLIVVLNRLYEHPEGATPRLSNPDGSRAIDCIKDCKKFAEMTGSKGDVILMHPFAPHSAAKNHLRNIRIIANPAVSVNQPFNFDREDGDYSLVEKKTLALLGKDRLPGWKITSERDRWRPASAGQAWKDSLVRRELSRLIEHSKKTGEPVESMWLDESKKALREGMSVDNLPTVVPAVKVN